MTTKERPILFSAPMVRAILDGRKTQTRRICKQAEKESLSAVMPAYKSVDGEQRPPYLTLGWFGDKDGDVIFCCPYGIPGDRLWVRETWQHSNYPLGPYQPHCQIFYRADYANDPLGIDLEKSNDGLRRKWNPSIHMPRCASRILLEITNVRVERLNDIGEEDAIAEGLKAITKDNGRTIKYGIPDSDGLPGEDDHGWHWHKWNQSPIAAYKSLWESINGAGSWDLNPWVWVIEFILIERRGIGLRTIRTISTEENEQILSKMKELQGEL